MRKLRSLRGKIIWVVCYYRVSSKEQEDNNSLTAQRELAHKECERKGWTILAEFEEAKTAKNFQREEWQKMMSFIKSHPEVGAILVKDAMRFSRDDHEAQTYLKELKRLDVHLHYILTPVDRSSPMGRFSEKLQLAYAQAENEQRADNIQRGCHQSLKDGYWYLMWPRGYEREWVHGKKPSLKINPVTGPIVCHAFEMVADGKSQEEARKYLNQNGLKVVKSGIRKLLTNRIYLGEVPYEGKEEDDRQRKPEDPLPHRHPALVSEELFNMVQVRLSKKVYKKSVSKVHEPFQLKGLIKCPNDNKATGCYCTGKTKKIPYYQCNCGCKERINTYKADEQVLLMLQRHQLPKWEINMYFDTMKIVLDDMTDTQRINYLNQ